MTIATQGGFRVIDSHTGGEPTRLIIEGGPDLGTGPLAERRRLMQERFDHYRTLLCTEPRGSDVMVGGLLCEPVDASCVCGVIYFNNVGYLGMCGHGTIGLIETLRHLGRIRVGTHRIETPVGVVTTTLHEDGRVSVRNVRAYRVRKDVAVEVPAIGRVVGDVAWGGNWFFLVPASPEWRLDYENVAESTTRASAIMAALAEQDIRGDDGRPIDHVEFVGPPSDASVAEARNFVLCPGGAWDRSPCGTGTSAKLACLAADGKLAPGQIWRQQSPIGSVFEGRYEPADMGGILPTITGRAFVTADVHIIVDPSDPFAFGLLRR